MNKNSFLRYRFAMQSSCSNNRSNHDRVVADHLVGKKRELQGYSNHAIKTITLGDIITLDRAVQRDTRSVVYFITKIDPAEIEADLEKLRKVILNLEESLRSATANGKTEIQDDSLFNYFVAPFRQRPRPKLLTEYQSKITAKVDSKILASASSTGDMPLAYDHVNIVSYNFLTHANKSMSHR